MPQPLVTNAANPGQVKTASRKERDREGDRLAAYKAVMTTPAGRLVLWDLLTRAGVYQSCYARSGSDAFVNIGRQDFGHELMASLIAADEDGYDTMAREQRKLAKREDLERAAAHTAQAAKGE